VKGLERFDEEIVKLHIGYCEVLGKDLGRNLGSSCTYPRTFTQSPRIHLALVQLVNVHKFTMSSL
jgi:hypothetical protein